MLEKGFDVIYVSSPDFFSKLEALHFGQDPAGEEETLLRTAAGAGVLALLAQTSGALGIQLGVNLYNALVLGVLGAPGFGLLLMLNWLVRSG